MEHIESLKAVNKLRQANPALVQSIDVVARPPKRFGRGLKQWRDPPVVQVATQLQLPLHRIDTFTGWKVPEGINLIIAVSFGLLVPRRILDGVKYGGLNVHPSLLPDLRGAAPVHWVLLRGSTSTGVTVQTLHPSRMDRGKVLLQTPEPGFMIPNPGTIGPGELSEVLRPIGAEMLSQVIEQRLFVSPVNDLTPPLHEDPQRTLSLAPKISPEHRHIDWNHWTADDILRYQRVIGPLWNMICFRGARRYVEKRAIWEAGWSQADDVEAQHSGLLSDEASVKSSGKEPCVSCIGDELFVRTHDGVVLVTRSVKIEGEKNAAIGRIGEMLCGEDSTLGKSKAALPFPFQ